MSIKRRNSRSYIQNRFNNDSTQRTSGQYNLKDDKPIQTTSSNTQIHTPNKILLEKSQKQQIPPEKLKKIRHIFTTITNSQSMPIERLTDALLAFGYDTQKDIRYKDFLIEHELNETLSGSIDFEYFVLLILDYEEKIHIEEEALRRLDLKIAFECFDINKDGMIDANELSIVMNILGFSITDQEAKDMIEFADHDKDSLLSFDEFLTVLTQISSVKTK